jgi:fumarate reductase flavoprotein subunit
MGIRPAAELNIEYSLPVAIIGGGACGMVAALTLSDAGIEAVVLERDPVPQGSTAMSSGMIPACGSSLQAAQGVADNVEIMSQDILAKCKFQADAEIVEAICRESGPTIDWLCDRHDISLTLVEGFLYPGHRRLRMHAPPSRKGADLIAALDAAVARSGQQVLTNARVTDLFADNEGTIKGLSFTRPDGSAENLGCDAAILANNGYGGNPEMLRRFIPEMAQAEYFGHVGNQGDAVSWGQALGADLGSMSAYQGHGSIAIPQRILITWALIMEGGIQVNRLGQRFNNEHEGYSEQAVDVLAQPGAEAWVIFDDRLLTLGRDFEDFRDAEEVGALRHGADARELANSLGLPPDALEQTFAECRLLASGVGEDRFGRDFTGAAALATPYHAIKVTGALLHTQGGVRIDTKARVLRPDGSHLPNLFAGGGAAQGISGDEVHGYLSGNGLLTAVNLGRIAGREAAALVGDRGGNRRES